MQFIINEAAVILVLLGAVASAFLILNNKITRMTDWMKRLEQDVRQERVELESNKSDLDFRLRIIEQSQARTETMLREIKDRIEREHK